jgi:hypothetical protein
VLLCTPIKEVGWTGIGLEPTHASTTTS